MRRRRRIAPLAPGANVIRNTRDVPDQYQEEIEAAAERALGAGARPPLHYVGMGMTGIVFADRTRNLAYKVARGDYARFMLAEEAEWFRSAARNAATKERVPGGVRWNEKHGVLVRQYIHGGHGAWSQESKLWDIHQKLKADMIPQGWTAPEFKRDSWVYRSRGRGQAAQPVLVDGSMPNRVGKTLLRYALDVAAGKRSTREPLSDIAFSVYAERQDEQNPRGTIPTKDVRRALAALRAAGGNFEWTV